MNTQKTLGQIAEEAYALWLDSDDPGDGFEAAWAARGVKCSD